MLRHQSQTTQITSGLLCFTAGLVKHFTICHLAKKKGGGYSGMFGEGRSNSESISCRHLADPPNNTSVSFSSPAQEGSSVTLSCDCDSNPAADSYTWYKVAGGQEVTEVGSEKTLSAVVSEDDSQFYCRASNRYGAQNSSVAQIDVLCESGNKNKKKPNSRQILRPVAPKPVLPFVQFLQRKLRS